MGVAFPIIQRWLQVALEGRRFVPPGPTAVPVDVLQEGFPFFLFELLGHYS